MIKRVFSVWPTYWSDYRPNARKASLDIVRNTKRIPPDLEPTNKLTLHRVVSAKRHPMTLF
jgi:hypothetical protein